MSSKTTGALWNALIRTHHITSRKKVAKLKQAATTHNVFALLRSGGCPGIMYVQGSQAGVESWVAVVQKLRYKDYHLASKPAPVSEDASGVTDARGILYEIESVKDYAARMDAAGLLPWWRKAMGFSGQDDRL
ncbi:hypothetical protein LTR78_000045 [Recurvomyces mirabilis]|uniref:Uncharacterized protein n=1 Tax=Recurvomyces mirabilis TaxID=574656 RepID=A0AAE1C677_9PEZI|nr:hypothetical protein LTR78_000045 [Recurvomyces mirabilis]KAK5161701.1 hypothetical protein LTS14_000046 [Recurvomyces mirabilis]